MKVAIVLEIQSKSDVDFDDLPLPVAVRNYVDDLLREDTKTNEALRWRVEHAASLVSVLQAKDIH